MADFMSCFTRATTSAAPVTLGQCQQNFSQLYWIAIMLELGLLWAWLPYVVPTTCIDVSSHPQIAPTNPSVYHMGFDLTLQASHNSHDHRHTFHPCSSLVHLHMCCY